MDRYERERALRVRFIRFFPKQCRPQLLERLKMPGTDGLQQLMICLSNGIWEGQPLPHEVAEVYLNDPKATPWLRCSQCELVLPKRSGFWHNTNNGKWWQSCMRYFAKCPGCQGKIVPRGQDLSWRENSPFPVQPVPPWEFLDAPL